GLPQFARGGGLEGHEQSSRARAVNKIIFQKWRRSIAENAAGARGSVGPENFCRRLGLIELKHQTADEEPICLHDRSRDGCETGASARYSWLAPINRAIGRIQRGD